MSNDIEVIFFDLFFTLVTPNYRNIRNENDVLGITKEEWERYAEDDELYIKRATSNKISPEKIIEDIIGKMKISINAEDKIEILKLRKERIRRCLTGIDSTILNAVSDMKKSGKKLCLISNADVIDAMYWKESPLSNFFHDAIFSYEVGYLKPQIEIYNLALEKMKVNPKNCVFVGDGGSDELRAAREIGMKTIMTGYLLKRDKVRHAAIIKFADYYVEDFGEIKNILCS